VPKVIVAWRQEKISSRIEVKAKHGQVFQLVQSVSQEQRGASLSEEKPSNPNAFESRR
jgi:hypothetical protein